MASHVLRIAFCQNGKVRPAQAFYIFSHVFFSFKHNIHINSKDLKVIFLSMLIEMS